MLAYDRGDLHPRLVVVLLLRSNVLPQEGIRLDVERARFLRREERGRYLNEGATHSASEASVRLIQDTSGNSNGI